MCFISSSLILQIQKQSRGLYLLYILSSIHSHTTADILYLSVGLQTIMRSMYLEPENNYASAVVYMCVCTCLSMFMFVCALYQFQGVYVHGSAHKSTLKYI